MSYKLVFGRTYVGRSIPSGTSGPDCRTPTRRVLRRRLLRSCRWRRPRASSTSWCCHLGHQCRWPVDIDTRLLQIRVVCGQPSNRCVASATQGCLHIPCYRDTGYSPLISGRGNSCPLPARTSMSRLKTKCPERSSRRPILLRLRSTSLPRTIRTMLGTSLSAPYPWGNSHNLFHLQRLEICRRRCKEERIYIVA